MNGTPPLQPLNILAAVGVALALAIPLDLIRAGIETFAAIPAPAQANS
jgi:UDP-N-acetylmuramyl tripeptide synthase